MGLQWLPVVLFPAGIEFGFHVGRHERLNHGSLGSAVGGLYLEFVP